MPVFAIDDFEADDVVGTIVLKAESEDIRSLILTDDADQLQLVTDGTNLLNLTAVAAEKIVKEIAAKMLLRV